MDEKDKPPKMPVSTRKFQVGGQAVIEGVMMRSPKSFTVAIQKSKAR